MEIIFVLRLKVEYMVLAEILQVQILVLQTFMRVYNELKKETIYLNIILLCRDLIKI